MTQVLIFISKRQDRVIILPFTSIEKFVDEINNEILGENKIGVLELNNDFPIKLNHNLNILKILKFSNVPENRHVSEIAAAIYYAAAINHIVDGVEIISRHCILDLFTNPKEIIDPSVFSWNLADTIERFVRILPISISFDFFDEEKGIVLIK